MVTIGMNYRVIPGKNEEFEDKFRAVLVALNAGDDHEQSNLFKDIDDTDSYLIVSNWATLEAFQAFIQSDGFKEVTADGMANLLSERPRHKVYKH
jgi:heme-degrading monooxygenase HmoA